MDMDSSLSGAPELRSNASRSNGFASNLRAVSHILTKVLNITNSVSVPNGIGKWAVLELSYTEKNDLTRRVTHREAVFGPVIHSIFDAWHYEVLWTSNLTRLL
jgi:hypothetical protein